MNHNILFIYPGDTANPNGSGGQKRAYHLIKELSSKNTLHVLETEDSTLSTHPVSNVSRHQFTHPLPRYLIDLYPPLVVRIRQIVTKHDIDLIHVAFPSGVPASALASQLSRSSPPVVFDAQSVAGSFLPEITTDANIPFYKKLGGKFYIPLVERAALWLSDQVNVVSNKDRELFESIYGAKNERFVVIPSGVPEPEIKKSPTVVRKEYNIPSTESTIVFHGGYDYQPNRRAIEFLKNEVAPELSKKHDDFSIVIAGNGVPEEMDLPIRSVGYVDDLFSFLNSMDIATVPLSSGGGIKMKTLDYMSVGLPIVSSPVGAEGIDVVDGKHMLVTDGTKSDLINSISDLLADPDLQAHLSQNIHSLVDEKYRWDNIGEIINSSYDAMVE